MDNNQNRETEKIIMSVQKAAFLMDPFFKITAVGTVMLFTHLARLQKEGKLSKGEFKNVQEFIKLTEGDYTIVNVPATLSKGGTKWLGQDAVDKELADLKKLGVRFVTLPDLNAKDGYVQVMVYNKDKELFSNWFEQYLGKKMSGGQHELQNLQNLTYGKTSIISIPFEGQEKQVLSDFEVLGINYAILPDLHVGDGEIQLVVANADTGKVEHWFKMYQSDQLKQGNEVHDMRTVNMETYMKTGEMSEETYVDTASQEVKAATEKYEGQEPGMVERAVREGERRNRKVGNSDYESYRANPDFFEFSIDKQTLVDNMNLSQEQVQEFSKRGYFASRVPTTWGKGTKHCDSERILLVPWEQVFTADEGTRYAVFLDNRKPCELYGVHEGKIVERMPVDKMYTRYYDRPEHQSREVEREDPLRAEKQKERATKDMNNFNHRNYNYENLEAALLNQESKASKMLETQKTIKPPVKVR